MNGFWGTHPQCGVPMGSSPKPYPPRCLTHTKHGATSARAAHWPPAPYSEEFPLGPTPPPPCLHPGTKHGSDLCPPARCSFPREAKGREQGEEQRGGGKADVPPQGGVFPPQPDHPTHRQHGLGEGKPTPDLQRPRQEFIWVRRQVLNPLRAQASFQNQGVTKPTLQG